MEVRAQNKIIHYAGGMKAELIGWEPLHSWTDSFMLFPGMGMPAQYYMHFAKLLTASSGKATYVHEWRGAGSSSWRADRKTNWDFLQVLEDMEVSLAQLTERTQKMPILIGHSLGGQLAAVLSARSHEVIQHTITIGASTPYWKAWQGTRRISMRLSSLVAPTICDMVGYFPGKRLGFAGREARGTIKDWCATVRTGQYLHGKRDDMPKRMATYKGKLLIIGFEEDTYATPSSIKAFYDLFTLADREMNIHTTADNGRPYSHFNWVQHNQAMIKEIMGFAKKAAATK